MLIVVIMIMEGTKSIIINMEGTKSMIMEGTRPLRGQP